MKSSTYLEPYKHHAYVPVQVGFIIMEHKNSQYHIIWFICSILYTFHTTYDMWNMNRIQKKGMESRVHSKKDSHMICARMCVYQIKHVTFLLTPQKDLKHMQRVMHLECDKNTYKMAWSSYVIRNNSGGRTFPRMYLYIIHHIDYIIVYMGYTMLHSLCRILT